MYQGKEWDKNQTFVDRLRKITSSIGRTVAQIFINWTINRPGITAALCGAKRSDQIEETARAMGWQLTDQQRAAIDAAIMARAPTATKRPFS